MLCTIGYSTCACMKAETSPGVIHTLIKGGVEGPAGPAIAVPLFLAVRNAGALFSFRAQPNIIIPTLCVGNFRMRTTVTQG